MATMAQSIRMALHYAEKNLQLEEVFGQDVGEPLGGIFTCTQGLKTTWNSPLDERGIIGTAIGIGLTGTRCVAEIQFVDYIFNSIDLLKQAGMMSWVSEGRYPLPIVVMTPVGAGIHGSIYHSHSFDSWATKLPGWKIVSPSNSLDAYGLLLSAIKDPNPVLFLIPKALLRIKSEELLPNEPSSHEELKAMIDTPVKDKKNWKPQWPSKLQEYIVPIGKAKKAQEGTEITVISWGRCFDLCKKAVAEIRCPSIELIDLRSLIPYDWKCIKHSTQKTKKILFVNEDTEVSSFLEHLAYRVNQECFYELYAPPTVLSAKNVPGIGLHSSYENHTVPTVKSIQQAIYQLHRQVP